MWRIVFGILIIRLFNAVLAAYDFLLVALIDFLDVIVDMPNTLFVFFY